MSKGLIIGMFYFTFCSISGYAQIQQEWIKSPSGIIVFYGGLMIDLNDYVYIAGEVDTTGIGGLDDFFYIAKYDSRGNRVFENYYKGFGDRACGAKAISIDSMGNLYAIGYCLDSLGMSGLWHNDWIAFKYNSTGIIQYSQRFHYATGYSIFSDKNGNVLEFGRDTISFIVLKKSNLVGNILWTKYPNTSCPNGTITTDKSGSIYLAYGSWTNPTNIFCVTKYDSSVTKQWEQTYTWPTTCQLMDFALDDKGNVYLGGWYYGVDQDYCLIKYDSSGNQKWVTTYNNSLGNWVDRAFALTVDKSDNVYITGETSLYCCPPQSDADFGTVKYDSNGVQQWVAFYNGAADSADQADAIAVDDSGNVYVAGSSIGTGMSEEDYVIVKYDKDGNQKWVVRYDGGGQEYANQLIVDKDGNIYVSGFGPTIKYCQYGSRANFSANNDSVPPNDAINFTNASTNAAHLLWDFGDGIIDSTNYNASHSYTSEGIFTVKLKTWNACGADSMSLIMNVDSNFLGIKKENIKQYVEIKILPNPFSTSATIRIMNNEQGIKNYELKMYDLLGREMKSETIRNSDTFVIRRGDLPAGMYFYKLTDKEKILATGKIVIQ